MSMDNEMNDHEYARRTLSYIVWVCVCGGGRGERTTLLAYYKENGKCNDIFGVIEFRMWIPDIPNQRQYGTI